MKHGYARVRTENQNPAMQLAALKNAGRRTVFKKELTAAHVNRRAIARCPRKLQAGAVLAAVQDASRRARGAVA